MKKIVLSLVLFLIMLVAIIVPIYALPPTWSYKFPINVKDIGGTARTYVPVDLGIAGSSLTSSGYMASSGLDTYMYTGSFGGTTVQSMIGTTKIMAVIPSLPGNGSVVADLYTGYTPVRDYLPIVLGSSGYITTTDNAALEMGSTGIWRFNGYLNTSPASDQDIISKTSAFKTYVRAVDSSLRAKVYTSTVTAGSPLSQTNAAGGTLSFKGNFGSPASMVAERINSFSGEVTSIGINVYRDAALTDGTLVGEIYSVAGTLLGSSNAVTISTLPTSSGTYTTFTFADPVEIYNTSIRVALHPYTSDTTHYLYAKNSASDVVASAMYSTYNGSTWTDNGSGYDLNFQSMTWGNYTVVASATGITSGEHTVYSYLSGGNLMIDVDSVNKATVSTNSFSVTDNANNWVLTVPQYMNWIDEVVTTQKLLYQPSTIITGTTMTDSVGSYNGTITYGSNSNITLTYGSIASYNTTSTSPSTSNWYSPTLTMITGWFSSGSNISQLPLYGLYSSTATDTGIPAQTLYIFTNLAFAFFFALIIINGTRTIFLGILAACLVIFIGCIQTLYPMWIMFVDLLLPVGVLFVWRQQ